MDSHQAIYDAVRSRISNGDIGAAIERVAQDRFDISNAVESVRLQFIWAINCMARPSVLYRPTLSADGTKWCALLGENLQEGVSGFGDTPADAMEAFDKAFNSERTPAATRAAREV